MGPYVALGCRPRDPDDTLDAGREVYAPNLDRLLIFTWGNFAFVLASYAIICLTTYWALFRSMVRDPVRVHRASLHKPLDPNEILLLFRALDRDGNGLLELKELVEICLSKSDHGALKVRRSQSLTSFAQPLAPHITRPGREPMSAL